MVVVVAAVGGRAVAVAVGRVQPAEAAEAAAAEVAEVAVAVAVAVEEAVVVVVGPGRSQWVGPFLVQRRAARSVMTVARWRRGRIGSDGLGGCQLGRVGGDQLVFSG